MNKVFLGLTIAIIILGGLGWLLLYSGPSAHVSVIEREVSGLENYLIEIEAELASGELSLDIATATISNIASSLELIKSSATVAGSSRLNEEQLARLDQSLNRFLNVLVGYSDTLLELDKQIQDLPLEDRQAFADGEGGVADLVLNTVYFIDESVAEVLTDFAVKDIETALVSKDDSAEVKVPVDMVDLIDIDEEKKNGDDVVERVDDKVSTSTDNEDQVEFLPDEQLELQLEL